MVGFLPAKVRKADSYYNTIFTPQFKYEIFYHLFFAHLRRCFDDGVSDLDVSSLLASLMETIHFAYTSKKGKMEVIFRKNLKFFSDFFVA